MTNHVTTTSTAKICTYGVGATEREALSDALDLMIKQVRATEPPSKEEGVLCELPPLQVKVGKIEDDAEGRYEALLSYVKVIVLMR